MRLLSLLALCPGIAFANVCPTSNLDLGSVIGAGVGTGTTVGAGNTFTPSCGRSTAEDYTYEYTTTLAGEYTFSLAGSGYDTVLSIIDSADCTTELACNDDAVGAASEITIALGAAQTVLVNVDGYAAGAGTYTLGVSYAPPPVCPIDSDLGSAVGMAIISGTTCGNNNNADRATCGATQDSEDVTFLWTAPAAGDYTFDLTGSTFDTAMTLRNGCTELACNDDIFPNNGFLTSQITETLAAGDVVSVVVDGFGATNCGDFELSIYAGCGDNDQDGICQANDACFGDDATGDSDNDQICDDTDFVLISGPPVAGQPLQLGVHNAQPGAQVAFAVTTTGPGAGPCLQAQGICLGILRPIILGRTTANANGDATLTVNVPPTVPVGTRVGFQAAWFTANTGRVTEVDPQISR